MPALPPPTAPAEKVPAPASLAELFLAFNWLALQGFGGVLAVVQRELVERKRWMTLDEFVEDWAVAQVMPGPNVINLGLMLGDRFFGWRGAVVALLGLLTVPLVLVLCLGLVYSHYQQHPQVAGALRAMSAVAAGLIMATGLKLLPALRKHPLGVPLCGGLALVAFVAVALLRVPLMGVLIVVGGVSCVLTWRKLKP
ncbi:chromate transporter [Xylophilus sp. GOD-11R]|uniref:chromate transporter n=1 Tax=Xylophilus sp. GOD-11R TaxID=3089814 RepID=UPI00298BE553|nr:chromate transporter [Xylophilus sp. GOD-11R]WPB58207.1 chromate transporter [Xylophilus sp. GOD-11R]